MGDDGAGGVGTRRAVTVVRIVEDLWDGGWGHLRRRCGAGELWYEQRGGVSAMLAPSLLPQPKVCRETQYCQAIIWIMVRGILKDHSRRRFR